MLFYFSWKSQYTCLDISKSTVKIFLVEDKISSRHEIWYDNGWTLVWAKYLISDRPSLKWVISIHGLIIKWCFFKAPRLPAKLFRLLTSNVICFFLGVTTEIQFYPIHPSGYSTLELFILQPFQEMVFQRLVLLPKTVFLILESQ